MSYEDLQKPLVPATTPKEERKPKIENLSIPSKKETASSSYAELSKKLSPHDQEMLGAIKDYDSIKRTNLGEELGELSTQVNIQADQALRSRNPKKMADLRDKAQIVSLPKKF